MKFVGIDLHKKTISVCVVNKDRTVLERKKFLCVDVKGIAAWFGGLGEFSFVVEATATYEWLVQILEPLAASWQLVNPGKMRVIAESTKKSDKHDAQVLAEFLALGMIPRAYRPNARQREHRKLVRYRTQCQQRVSRLKCEGPPDRGVRAPRPGRVDDRRRGAPPTRVRGGGVDRLPRRPQKRAGR